MKIKLKVEHYYRNRITNFLNTNIAGIAIIGVAAIMAHLIYQSTYVIPATYSTIHTYVITTVTTSISTQWYGAILGIPSWWYNNIIMGFAFGDMILIELLIFRWIKDRKAARHKRDTRSNRFLSDDYFAPRTIPVSIGNYYAGVVNVSTTNPSIGVAMQDAQANETVAVSLVGDIEHERITENTRRNTTQE